MVKLHYSQNKGDGTLSERQAKDVRSPLKTHRNGPPPAARVLDYAIHLEQEARAAGEKRVAELNALRKSRNATEQYIAMLEAEAQRWQVLTAMCVMIHGGELTLPPMRLGDMPVSISVRGEGGYTYLKAETKAEVEAEAAYDAEADAVVKGLQDAAKFAAENVNAADVLGLTPSKSLDEVLPAVVSDEHVEGYD